MMDKSKTPRHDLRSCRYITLCRLLLAFVHHSIAILSLEVPNPNLTIRNFFIAVHASSSRAVEAPPVWMSQTHLARAQRPSAPMLETGLTSAAGSLTSTTRSMFDSLNSAAAGVTALLKNLSALLKPLLKPC
jgi:hypothetical protein